MPIVLRIKGYRFGFYASDRLEPPHVHVANGRASGKFWIDPIELERNHGFRPHELNEISTLLEENREVLLEAWHDFFGA